MSKKLWNAYINSIENKGCNKAEVESLIYVFCYTMRSISSTLAHKAEFNLANFEISNLGNIENFTLILEKAQSLEAEQWVGIFEEGNKTLKISGTLQKN